FDLITKLDLDTIAGLRGGMIMINFQSFHGENPSDALVGDLQGIDGLDGVPRTMVQDRTQLSRLWYEQRLWHDSFRFQIGKLDANSEFDHVDSAQEFVHQSMGSSATLLTIPTYPDPAMGFNLFYSVLEDTTVSFGLYDGSFGSGAHTGQEGPKSFLNYGQG